MFNFAAPRAVLVIVALCGPCFPSANDSDVVSKASTLSHAGKIKQAEAMLRSAVAANPQSAVLHGALGKLLFQQKRYEDSVEELGRAAQISPESHEYNLFLAEALLGCGRFQVAVDFLQAVRQRFDKDAQFHYDLGFAYYNLNKMALAQKEIEEAVRLAPNLDRAKYLLAGCLISAGDSARAIEELRKLVAEKPKNALYWVTLGQLLSHTVGGEAEALRVVRQALALNPRDAHVQFVAATVFSQCGDFAGARPLLERLAKLDPSVLAVHVQLARVYSRLGERELARRETEIANQLRQRAASPASPPPGEPTADVAQH